MRKIIEWYFICVILYGVRVIYKNKKFKKSMTKRPTMVVLFQILNSCRIVGFKKKRFRAKFNESDVVYDKKHLPDEKIKTI